jgi:hypothetical protein
VRPVGSRVRTAGPGHRELSGVESIGAGIHEPSIVLPNSRS